MARYIEIVPLGEIVDDGLVKGRIQLRVNFRVEKTHSNTFLTEILNKLQTASVGTFGTNMFGSSAVDIPDGAGPILTVRQTGGQEPARIHNSVALPAYQRPTFQVTVRASTFVAANTMICAAYNALVGVRNATLT